MHMGIRLPSLDLLRGFEAAARHLSFTRAAQELHVTQSAVSRQIKTIEEQLGVTLFRRLNRALLLTEEGQALSRAVAEALGGIEQAVARLSGLAEDRPIKTKRQPPCKMKKMERDDNGTRMDFG